MIRGAQIRSAMITFEQLASAEGAFITLQYRLGGSAIRRGTVLRVRRRTLLGFIPIGGWWVTFDNGHVATVLPEDNFVVTDDVGGRAAGKPWRDVAPVSPPTQVA